ncbi:MAG: PIN domain-containing protein [Bacteroidota bacterium]
MKLDRVFVDTNIILDWLGERKPHFVYARDLFALGENEEIFLLTSTMSFISVEYILKKVVGTQRIRQALTALRTISEVCSSGTKEIDLALNSQFKDFEDAFQYFSALNNEADIIITRSPKDFSPSSLPIMSAEEYLKSRLAS